MAVDKDYICRDTYRAIVTLLKSNLTDTQSPSRSTNNWVFSTFPDRATPLTQNDFPIVIVESPEFNSDNKTLTKTRIHMTFVVTVFTAGNNAAAYCDDVGDQIYHIVSDNKSTVLRNTYNLYDVEADGIVSTTTKYGEIKLHVKEITFRAHLIIDA